MRFLHIGMSVGDNGHAKGLRKAFPEYREVKVGTPTMNAEIIQCANEWKPELVFIQIQDVGISLAAFDALRGCGAFVINWSGDVRAKIPSFYFDYAKQINLTCFSNMPDVYTLRKLGYDSEFLQIGYDPEIYYPASIGAEKDIDIVFMGNHIGHFPLSNLRRQMVDELKSTYGDRFRAYGNGMPDGNYMGNQVGEAEIYRRAKIGINLSHFNYERYTSDRMFRMLGCGVCVLSHNYNGIEQDFCYKEEGGTNWKYITIWNQLGDLKNHINFLIDNPITLKGLSDNGHQLALDNHTFEHMGYQIQKLYEQYNKKDY